MATPIAKRIMLRCRQHNVLTDFKNGCLLLVVLVGIAHGQEVSALFRQDKKGIHYDSDTYPRRSRRMTQ
jgi:hypothetical protein